MNVTVFGIGYVGAVVAGCMSAAGHQVVAVDINPAKVDAVNDGRSPLAEPGLAELIAAGVAEGRLRATASSDEGFAHGEILFVCVGTPGLPNDRLDTRYLEGVAEDLGAKLAAAADGIRRTVVIRSTVLPGTMDGVVRPALERTSGLRAGEDFGLGSMPEFLREGQGIEDFNNPAVVVIGAEDPRSLDTLRALNNANLGAAFTCDFRTAEAIKFTNNAFHALKVAFANEVGAVCKRSGIDGRLVLDILCADTKLNISRAYLRPGFAFGGSCLPKDVRALCSHAQALGVRTNVLDSLVPSNEAHVARAVATVVGFGRRRVSLLGLTFKPGTDDLRDSALVELAERLIGKGFSLRIYDPNFSYADIMGRNREFLLRALPHVGCLLVDTLEDALDHAGTIIVGHDSSEFHDLPASDDQFVLDLASGAPGLERSPQYEGICW
jgi:GDP-mannose 6-dehydrogenase